LQALNGVNDNHQFQPARVFQSSLLGLTLALGTLFNPVAFTQPAYASSDPSQIVGCLVQKCPVSLGKCILNPICLANVACINTCNNRPDEIECQIKCGDTFDNSVIGEFNKCAVSDMSCVPQKPDDGSYPEPSAQQVVDKFDTKLFQGRWYISAGQNELFDTFPCQVHFFSNTGPGKFVGKLNWRIEEPDGEFFVRDALQAFVQDKEMPGHLLNHDNEYLHYKDDW
jgi:violaxanthin de-epoxidase